MTIGQILKRLITADSYAIERIKFSDDLIDFIRESLPHDYEYIAEKETAYQAVIPFIMNEGSRNEKGRL